MLVFGIDPGYSGAIAAIQDRPAGEPDQILNLIDMPLIAGGGKVKSEIDELAIRRFMEASLLFDPNHATFIEKVSSMPGQGVVSTFRFGVAYGIVRATSVGLSIPTHLIAPQAWQAAVGLPKSPDKVSRKALARQYVSRLFPQQAQAFAQVKDSGRAEAVLIAMAGLRLLGHGETPTPAVPHNAHALDRSGGLT